MEMVLLPSIFYVMIWNHPIEIATKLEIQVSLLAGQESKSRARENFRKMSNIARAWAIGSMYGIFPYIYHM